MNQVTNDIQGEWPEPAVPAISMDRDNDYEDHEDHHKRSVMAKVKAKAKKWKHLLSKRKHKLGQGAEPADSIGLDEKGKIELDAEYHGAPMYESEVAPNTHKESAIQHQPAIQIPITHDEPEIHQFSNAYMEPHMQNSGVSLHKEPELQRLDSFKETSNPNTSTIASAIADQCVSESNSMKNSGVSLHKEPELQRLDSFKETSNPNTSTIASAIADQCVSESNSMQNSGVSLHKEPELQHLDSFKETSNPNTSTIASAIADQCVSESNSMQNSGVSLHKEPELQCLDSFKETSNPNTSTIASAIADQCVSESNAMQNSGVSLHKEPELQRLDSFKETSNPNTSTIASAIADQCVSESNSKQDDTTQEDNNSRTLSETVAEVLAPAYNAVTEMTNKITSKIQGTDAEDEKGAKLVYDKGVSVKEYVINKLQPGDDDKALSNAITEAVNPSMTDKTEEGGGVMEKVKEAFSSLLGMEERAVGSSPIPVTSYPQNEGTEPVGERRLQEYTN